MTERTVSELREDLLQYMQDPRTEQEIKAHMAGEDRDIIEGLMLAMARWNRIHLASGCNGKKWVTTRDEQEEDEEVEE